jgi:hypothetical protein
MKIISGGQSGVDRAALDVAIDRGIAWGGWCPAGGWAEDFPDPPGLLASYPLLRETPDRDPSQRTEWNARDSDAILIITDREGLSGSPGTRHAHEWAEQHGKPLFVAPAGEPDAAARAAAWVRDQRQIFGPDMTLSVGGPRESEAPGIYARAKSLLAAMLDALEGNG